MAKKTAVQVVQENIGTLRTMDHRALTAFGKTNGFDSRAGFAAYKKALAAAGIDYDRLRAAAKGDQRAAMSAAATASLTLITDAKARTERFAICDRNGEPVWHGRFFDNDRDFNGEQSSGEMAAAKKAVWLAGKVREAIGAAAIRLTLKVDAQWLTHANVVAAGEMGGGKARQLGELAERSGVVLVVEHIPGAENPADKYTVCSGYQRWQDADLTDLLDA